MGLSGRPNMGRDRTRDSNSSEGEKRQGTKRGKGVGEVKGKNDEESLERLLEREMVDRLKDENEKLKEEESRNLPNRSEGSSSLSSRTEVTQVHLHRHLKGHHQ